MYEQFNRIAIEETLRHMLGQDGLDDAIELYRVVDAAATKAYQLASLETLKSMQPVLEEAVNAGQAAGFEAGHRAGHDAGWREGYLTGVARARTAPDVADAIVASIIDEENEKDTELFLEGSARAVAEQDDTMPLPEFYQGDSGDEDPYCVACGEYQKSCVGCE